MKHAAVVVLLLLLVPAVVANGVHRPAANHSPSVYTFAWAPVDIVRGETLRVGLLLNPGVQVDSAFLVYCRVREYACAPALEMNGTSGGRTWETEIAWTPENDRFFEKTTKVGLNVTLKHQNGTQETSPVKDWPDRPAELPPEAGFYYYYSLPPPPEKSPALGVLLFVLALASAVFLRRRT